MTIFTANYEITVSIDALDEEEAKDEAGALLTTISDALPALDPLLKKDYPDGNAEITLVRVVKDPLA